jgi:hypothetical protein
MLEKTFVDIKELITFVYDNQIITEVWELSADDVSDDMLLKLKNAKMMEKSDFVNL